MKRKALIFTLAFLVSVFLAKGVEIIFMPEPRHFKYFLYLLCVFIVVLVHPFLSYRAKIISRKRSINKIKRIKKKGDLEKLSI